jgi:hypothetical protein
VTSVLSTTITHPSLGFTFSTICIGALLLSFQCNWNPSFLHTPCLTRAFVLSLRGLKNFQCPLASSNQLPQVALIRHFYFSQIRIYCLTQFEGNRSYKKSNDPSN